LKIEVRQSREGLGLHVRSVRTHYQTARGRQSPLSLPRFIQCKITNEAKITRGEADRVPQSDVAELASLDQAVDHRGADAETRRGFADGQ
jgi:hypothetical protein